MFRIGLEAMLEHIRPAAVLVHGRLPEEVFAPFAGQIKFCRYPSQIERAHRKAG